MRRIFALACLLPVLAAAQLRVAAWNISNYSGGRTTDIQNVVHATFQGRSMSPDALACEEILSASAQTALLNALNTAPGSPGTWAAAPFTDGNDTDNAFFYRTDRLSLVASTIIATGGAAPLPPRDTKRYDVRLLGYGVLAPKIAIYVCHMKAGTLPEDMSRRLAEATAIRTNAQGLTGFDGFAVVGDFNVYSSSDDAYQKLIGSEANNVGRFFDPISTSGPWDGQVAYKFVHTQDPATSSGMNSRFDFILLCQSLRDGQGFDYIGNPNTPYSTLTWDDAQHSYRAWGNDGSSFGNPLTVTGNTMVGPTIAQSIRAAATTNGGHVPVFLDLRVPAEAGASASSLDFGTVVLGSSAQRSLTISNTTSTTVWRTGIAELLYQLTATSGFSAPSGAFTDPAGGGGNAHTITMETATAGVKTGTLIVASTVPGTNSLTIPMTGHVVPDELVPGTYAVTAGSTDGGALASLFSSDDDWLSLLDPTWVTKPRGASAMEATISAVSPVPSVSSIQLRLESQSNGFDQAVDVWDRVSGSWLEIDRRTLIGVDTAVTLTVPDPSRALNPATGELRMRLRYVAGGGALPRVARAKVDKAVWVLR